MAFIDIEQDESIRLDSSDTVQLQIDGYESASREIEHQQQVEDATFMEKWSGFSDTWDTTYMGRAIDYMSNDLPVLLSTTVDKKWQMDNTDKVMNERLNDIGIQPKFFRQFADAKNEKHFNAISNRVIETQDAERNVADTLNNYGMGMTEQLTATLVTNIADVDSITSGGLAIATKMATLRTLMMRDPNKLALGVTGIHAATAKIAYETDPNVSGSEAVFFGTIGAVADFGQVRYYKSRLGLPEDDAVNGVANGKNPASYKAALQSDLDSIRNIGTDHIEFSQYVDGIEALSAAKIITDAEAAELLRGLRNKSVMSKVKIRLKAKMNADGTVSVRGSAKKFTVGALATAGIVTEAEGADGFTVTAFGLGAIALLGAAGYLTVRSAKMAGITFDMAANKEIAKDFFKDIPELKDLNAESFRTSLFETTQPIRDAFKKLPDGIREKANELLTKLLFDTSDGTVMTLERNRDRMFNKWDKRSLDIMSTGYRQWLRENGVGSIFDNEDVFGHYIGSRNAFEQMVFEHMEGIKLSDNPHIIKAANEIDGLTKRIQDELAESVNILVDKLQSELNTKISAERKAEIEAMIKEVGDILDSLELNKLRYENMHVIVNNMDADGVDALIKQLTAMAGVDDDIMEGVLNSMKSGKTFKEALEDAAEFIAKRPESDVKPIVLNKAKFTPFEYKTISGEYGSMTLNDLFEINPSMALSTYAKDVAGQIALLDSGLSEKSVLKFIDELKVKHGVDEVAVQDLTDAVNLVLGRPILDQSSTLSKFRRDASNYVMALTMGLSVLSQLPEVMRMLFTGDPTKMASLGSTLNQIFKGYKHKGILSELLDEMGLAMDTKGLQFGAVDHIGDNNINVSTGRLSSVGNVVTKGGEIGRDASLYMMVQASDFLTKLAMMRNLEKLSDVVSGRSKMSADRMKIFGLTESNMAMLKKKIGTMPKKLNLAEWSREDRLEFYKIIQNMTMKDVQATTLGNAPAWQRNSEFGAAISLLTRFSTGAIANHGIYAAKGLRNGDAFAVGRENVGMFVGGYVAAALRDSLAGKEYDHDKYVVYAILGLGIAQPFEVVKSLADPAIFSKSADLADVAQSVLVP